MSNRFKTPDILGNIMGGSVEKEESVKAIKKEMERTSNKGLTQENNKTIIPLPSTPSTTEALSVSEPPVEMGSEPKEKVTFNLPVALLGELEDKWMEIRKLTGSRQISKTLIVERALELAFLEFDARKQESGFYSKLVINKAAKQ